MIQVTEENVKLFREMLVLDDRSTNTIKQYMHSIEVFSRFAEGRELDKKLVLSYKDYLKKKGYKVTSINAMLVPVNRFLTTNGYPTYTVKLYKVQDDSFRQSNLELKKSDYFKLLDAAREKNQYTLFAIMLTLGMTGMRVSELKFITVEDLEKGYTLVFNKAKWRYIVLSAELRGELQRYCRYKKIDRGRIFVTRNGQPIDRRNILRSMKKIGIVANVSQGKIFPHNFRHFFAVTYYEQQKDISHLADILGHNNLDTTRRYAKVSLEEEDAILSKMNIYTSFEM